MGKSLTKEEKAARMESLHTLARRVSELGEDGQSALLARFGAVFTAEGRPLSVFNTAFVLAQLGRPCAQVGGFKQWIRAGRCVREGEHAGCFIYVPLGGKASKEDECKETGMASEGEKKRTPVRFRLVPMFAIDQTEPLPSEASSDADPVAVGELEMVG